MSQIEIDVAGICFLIEMASYMAPLNILIVPSYNLGLQINLKKYNICIRVITNQMYHIPRSDQEVIMYAKFYLKLTK